MQIKEQKISPIKQRILQYIDTLSISKRTFYAKTGISRGTLESKTGITEDILAKFIASFGEISIEWLILGIGSPIKQKQEISKPESQTHETSILISIIKNKDADIREMAEEIGALKEQNRILRKQIGYGNSSIAAEK